MISYTPTPDYYNDYICHFNKNHDPKNGQFTTGSGAISTNIIFKDSDYKNNVWSKGFKKSLSNYENYKKKHPDIDNYIDKQIDKWYKKESKKRKYIDSITEKQIDKDEKNIFTDDYLKKESKEDKEKRRKVMRYIYMMNVDYTRPPRW